MAEALKHNETLLSLELDHNEFGPLGTAALQDIKIILARNNAKTDAPIGLLPLAADTEHDISPMARSTTAPPTREEDRRTVVINPMRRDAATAFQTATRPKMAAKSADTGCRCTIQ